MSIEIVPSHRIAFIVKIIAPTNTLGARVKASHPNNSKLSVTIQYHTDDSWDDCARAFATKMGWSGKMAKGGVAEGYVYVFID